MIVVNPTSSSTSTWAATYSAYADGILTGSLTTGAIYPQAITRTNSWLGRLAASPSSYLSAYIDAIRIYPYALPAYNIGLLWTTVYYYTGAGLPTGSFSALPTPVSSSAPRAVSSSIPVQSSSPPVVPTSTPVIIPSSTPVQTSSPPVVQTSTPVPVPTSSPVPASTGSVVNPPATSSSSSSSLGTGAIVGIAIGGAAGLLLVCILCYFWCCLPIRKEKKLESTAGGPSQSQSRHSWTEMNEKPASRPGTGNIEMQEPSQAGAEEVHGETDEL